jgi:hypothetical protein
MECKENDVNDADIDDRFPADIEKAANRATLTVTIFAITRFLIIEKMLRLARKRHTYGAISLSHYFIYYQLGFASRGDKVKLIKIQIIFFNLNRLKLIQKTEI